MTVAILSAQRNATTVFKEDRRLSIALLVLLGSLFLTNYAFVLSTIINIDYNQISKIIKLAPIIATVIVLPILYRARYSAPFLVVIVLLLFFYALSGLLVFSSHYKEYLTYFITVCLPSMIITYAIGNYQYFFTCLKYTSVVFALLSLVVLIMKFTNATLDTESDYFMAYSYSSAIFTLGLFNDVPVHRKWRIPVLLGKIIFIASILLLGARGPLLTIALFIIAKNLSSPKRSIGFKLAFFLISVVLLMIHEQIFAALNELALSFGIKSRTLQSLSGQSISLSGREKFYTLYIDAIASNPVVFRGIAKDWDLLGYPHNIFIELWYQLGIFGLVASIVIVVSIVYILLFKKRSDPITHTCDIFFLSIGIFTLLVSNSLWKSLQFWMWLGYMFNTRKGIACNASYRNQLL